MARATTRTLIPLDRAAQIIGIDPLHFNSVTSALHTEELACDDIWYQYDWQDVGKFSREMFAYVLKQAEDQVASYLGYYPLPTWIENEDRPIPQPLFPEAFSGNYNLRSKGKSILTRYGYVLAGGIQGKTLLDADAPIIFFDEDLDGYNELASVTISTTVTDKEEIHVFYPYKNGDDDWEIRPVDVVISGGLATITFPKCYIPLPELTEKSPTPDNPSSLLIDGDVDTNFLSTVDVYRVYNDDSQQAVLHFEPGSCGTDFLGTTQTAQLYVRDERRGFVIYRPATYNTTTHVWESATCTTCNYPERIRLWYYAGLRNEKSDYPTLRMVPDLERLIVYYALTLADTRVCGCPNFEAHLNYLREDLAAIKTGSTGSGATVSYQVTPDIMNCPFGTHRAAYELWKVVKRKSLGQSIQF